MTLRVISQDWLGRSSSALEFLDQDAVFPWLHRDSSLQRMKSFVDKPLLHLHYSHLLVPPLASFLVLQPRCFFSWLLFRSGIWRQDCRVPPFAAHKVAVGSAKPSNPQIHRPVFE